MDLHGNWKSHIVRHFNGSKEIRSLGTISQNLSGSWNRAVYGPNFLYIPEKDRLLLTLYCDRRRDSLTHSMISHSDDRGATWSEPVYMHINEDGLAFGGAGVALAYLGGGKVIFFAGLTNDAFTWYSYDHGETFCESRPWEPGPDGIAFYTWCKPLIDTDPDTGKTLRMMLGGYTPRNDISFGGYKVSYDEGKTWDLVEVPYWTGYNEIGFTRAANGDIIAALRTDGSFRYRHIFDHFSGLGISISTDNGYSWSEVKILYDWGRHHPDMVLLPDGKLVMTYVVRLGYPNTAEGYPRWGIEAVVSSDNGRSWDLDHRYILESWEATWKGPNAWLAGSQQTSSLLMPDGMIYTIFGTGKGTIPEKPPMYCSAMNVGLIAWTLDKLKTNNEKDISLATEISDKRNNFDPFPDEKNDLPEIKDHPNIALKEMGAVVRTSETDSQPSDILYDRYPRPVLQLETIPAWVEISWPMEHMINEIHILPGLPGLVDTPKTECVPLDYKLQYLNANEWKDLVFPVENAQTVADFQKEHGMVLIQEKEFEYLHRFPSIKTNAVRMEIRRTSDIGRRADPKVPVLVPENKRKTIIRRIEIMEA